MCIATDRNRFSFLTLGMLLFFNDCEEGQFLSRLKGKCIFGFMGHTQLLIVRFGCFRVGMKNETHSSSLATQEELGQQGLWLVPLKDLHVLKVGCLSIEFQVPFPKIGILGVVFGIMGSLYSELSRCVETNLLCLIQSHTVQLRTGTAEKPRIVVILRNNNDWFQLRKFFKLRK